jgi:Fe-Mn family superoxide dismutase
MSNTLPDLPYGYDALEPFISRQIMELHHKKHHQTYVNALNAAEAAYAKASTPKERIALQAALKFNGGGESIFLSACLTVEGLSTLIGCDLLCDRWWPWPPTYLIAIIESIADLLISPGHINHSLFWKNLAPASSASKGPGGALQDGPLKDAIVAAFGSLDNLKKEFNTTTAGIQGSGWGWLVGPLLPISPWC